MRFDQELGERVRALREDAGLTQEAVAEAMGVAVSTVSRLERGVSGINTRRLPALARALSVDVEDLFTGYSGIIPSQSAFGRAPEHR